MISRTILRWQWYTKTPMEYLLNTQQKQAVTYSKGPLLIIAGAGTGKTTVVTERIKHLILEQNVTSYEILALTFTEKAAREMEERVDIAMPLGYTQMWISTFHAFCDRILRNDAIQIGLTPGYRLMTQAESVQFFRNQLFQLDLDYYRPLGNPTKFVLGMIQHFSRLKDEDVSPREYLDYVQKFEIRISKSEANSKSKTRNLKQRDSSREELKKLRELSTAYYQYEKFKAKEGVMDFSDLIANTLLLFRKRPNVLSYYRKQFKHILVDEFQDTNIAQYELIKLLAPADANPHLAVVGDDSQSIYKFRGAAISNILSFMKDYKHAKQLVLNKNYRSTQTILDRSHTLIAHNDPDTLESQMGISKRLKKMRDIVEADIKFIYTERVEDEAEEIVESIQKIRTSEGRKWSDFALLVRANNHAEPFIRSFKRHRIPYQFLGPGMLFRQEEVKDLISYLKVINNFEDSLSFYRLLTMPLFDLNVRDIAALVNYAKKHNCSLFEAAEQILKEHVKESSQTSLSFIQSSSYEELGKIISMIYRHLALAPKESAGQILFYFLEDTGLINQLAEYTTVAEEKRAQNISKLFDRLKSFEAEHENASVSAVVDWIDLSMELGESPLANDMDWVENDAVNILTVHSSKGLEFPVVFLVNLTTGRFPTYERREQIPIPEDLIKETLPSGDYHVQEERRLFYVGMTRARDRLFLSAAKFYGEGKRERKVSLFINETLGKSMIDISKTNREKQLSFLDYQHSEQLEKPKTLPVKPITYLSYSQIETFKFCPMHYKARYVLKLPTPTYAAASYGQVMHQTMNMFYQKVKSGEKPSLKLMIDTYASLWNPAGFESKQHEMQMKRLGEKQLKKYFETQFSSKNLPADLEKKFIFPVTKNLKFGGIVDRIDLLSDGKLEIIDYKTSNKVPSQKEIDKNLQLTLYALAASEVYDIGRKKEPENILLSLYFFKDNVKLSTTRTREQLSKAQQEVIKIAEEIEHSDFACSGTQWCVNCEYKMLCSV